MYNETVLHYLAQISMNDRLPKDKKHQGVKVGDGMQQVIFYHGHHKVYFAVVGSAYLMAMTKWVQLKLQQKDWQALKAQDIKSLVEKFDLPVFKRQDALLILQLIEKLKDVE
ncbi:hypothetical protein [Facilibium subflavum]|uniref:hypothetical protein n=1 Tax=Facilibium subflavum TaxID=2219058 RepID=UPI000E64CD00|nr:hypothetical protein [Facilibium subflavum]